MAVRKEKGQDCFEIYIKGEDLDVSALYIHPNDDNEYRVCDVEEDGQIHWYVDEDKKESIINADDLKEIEDLSEELTDL